MPESRDAESRQQLAERFEECRSYLHAVAYRMLGSPSEADDAVQECWLRLERADARAIDELRRWLTVVVGRICIDMLRARHSQLIDYAGTWLPEPVVSVGSESDPEHDAVLSDSVSLALLTVLETLSPAERLSFVLHDIFAVSFDEIAVITDRTPAAARQLASRGRRRVRTAPIAHGDGLAGQRRVVEAFLAAARSGDFEGLIAILDPNVVLHTDGGGTGPLARPPIHGAMEVARFLHERGAPFAPMGRLAIVNGAIGVLVGRPQAPVAVIGLAILEGRIVEIDLIGDAAKISRTQIRAASRDH